MRTIEKLERDIAILENKLKRERERLYLARLKRDGFTPRTIIVSGGKQYRFLKADYFDGRGAPMDRPFVWGGRDGMAINLYDDWKIKK
jgi:hypothetical protein